MAKAMLIMDMPSRCKDCPMMKFTVSQCVCAITGKHPHTINRTFIRPSSCPLKYIPQKKTLDEGNIDGYRESVGYNACIDEILGGGE